MNTQQLERPIAQTPARAANQVTDGMIVPYTELKFENILVQDPLTQQYESLTEKDEQGNPKKGDFFVFKGQYLYGPPEALVPSRFIFRAPRVLARGGIKTKTTRTGEPAFSMMFSFDQTKQDSLAFIQAVSVIHYAFGWKAKDFRGKIKIPGFTADNSELMRKTGLKFPIYYPTNDNGDVIKGANPSMWVELIPKGRNKTVFKYPSLNIAKEPAIDWMDLSGEVDVTLEPELLVTHCTATAGSMTIKFKLVGGIVLDVDLAKSEILSQDHARELAQQDPSLGDHVKSKIEMIRNLRLTTEQDAKLPTAGGAPGGVNPTPTFAEVSGLGGKPAGPMVPAVPGLAAPPGGNPIPGIPAFTTAGFGGGQGVPNTPYGQPPTPMGTPMDITAFLRQAAIPATPAGITAAIPGMKVD